MSYIKPTDDHLARPFWQNLAKGRLCFERCSRCGAFRHPPGPICAACHSFDSEWVEAQGVGRLFSYTIVRQAAHPAVADWLPYAIGLVALAEGVRMVGRIETQDLASLRVEMPLRSELRRYSSDFALPVFVPA